MNNYQHLLISTTAAVIYLSLSGKPLVFSNFLPWLIGGVAIDIDHYFTCMANDKNFNLIKISKRIIRDYKQDNQRFYLFHSIEFAVFLSFIVVKTSLTWQYLAAYLLHLVCDGTRQRRLRKNYSWMRKWSAYLNFIR